MKKTASKTPTLAKARTGIDGLDEITGGGLPAGRPTLVCGGPGCGKTLFSMEFLVRGATQFDEPGVFMAFEETSPELAANVASLGFDLEALVARKKLAIDFVRVERSEIEESGEYDLEGLFIRLDHAIKKVGAKRVVLDTLESLFTGLSNQAILRSELRRLFRWLKDRGVTAVITGERGEGALTRQGLEEYVSDCVIILDHRVVDQASTRRLRVVKYRGTAHGTSEYPFLIDEKGFSVMPLSSARLDHEVSTERVSSGIARLDAMLGGKGFYRGSSILLSGTAGTGKTTISCFFAHAACARGERVLHFSFEESSRQISRNLRSVGLDLGRWERKGLLRFHSARPSLYGLEMHLVAMHKAVSEFKPRVVVLDPISALSMGGSGYEVTAMLTRLMDSLKARGITAMATSLTSGADDLETTRTQMSSLMDTWLLVRDIELNGERNRVLHVLKSRGMPHSNQVREFLMSDRGVELRDVYLGPSGVLTGSARLAQEAQDLAARRTRECGVEAERRGLESRRKAVEAQIEALRAAFAVEEAEADKAFDEHRRRDARLEKDRVEMSLSRKADR